MLYYVYYYISAKRSCQHIISHLHSNERLAVTSLLIVCWPVTPLPCPSHPTAHLHLYRYNERGVLEVQLFNIQMKLQAAKHRIWYPPEGKLISDINKAWVKLEAAEHTREVALRRELQRQERLEQLAEKFNRKAGLRESWLEDMFQVHCSDNFHLCTKSCLVHRFVWLHFWFILHSEAAWFEGYH